MKEEMSTSRQFLCIYIAMIGMLLATFGIIIPILAIVGIAVMIIALVPIFIMASVEILSKLRLK